MRLKLPFVLILSSFLLFSCATNRFESKFSPVYVTNTSKFALLPTTFAGEKIDSLQQMNAKFGEKEFETPVYVVSDETNLSMTILNEFGTTMANLFYDGNSLDFDSAVFPKNLKAEYIVADFQFCLYDASELKISLGKIGIDFETTVSKSQDRKTIETRTLTKKGKQISKITKTYTDSLQNTESPGNLPNDSKSNYQFLESIKYENFLRGYSYNLITID